MPDALTKLIPLILLFGAFIAVMFFLSQKSLNIKSKTVGDGQHGSASFATPKEINKVFKRVTYTPMAWRINNPENLPQGIIIGCNITKIWKRKK